MKSSLFGMKMSFGRFLEAVGRAMMAPAAGVGELTTEWMRLESVHSTPCGPNIVRLRLKMEGCAKLENLVVENDDGSTLNFPNLRITGLVIEARALPVFKDDLFRFFEVVETADQPALVTMENNR